MLHATHAPALSFMMQNTGSYSPVLSYNLHLPPFSSLQFQNIGSPFSLGFNPLTSNVFASALQPPPAVPPSLSVRSFVCYECVQERTFLLQLTPSLGNNNTPQACISAPELSLCKFVAYVESDGRRCDVVRIDSDAMFDRENAEASTSEGQIQV